MDVELNTTFASSILVINENGKLQRHHCPFMVKSIIEFEWLKEGYYYTVLSVKTSDSSLLSFLVHSSLFPHSFFEVLPKEGW